MSVRFVFPGEEYYVREVIDFSDGGVYLCRVGSCMGSVRLPLTLTCRLHRAYLQSPLLFVSFHFGHVPKSTGLTYIPVELNP